MGLVPFQPGSRRYISLPVEAALDGPSLKQLSMATQLPASRLAEMRPDPVDWTLTHSDVCTVCALCLDEDLCQGRDPYLRAEWRQSWRIFCTVHHVRLLRCPMSAVKGSASDPRVIEQVDDLYGCSNIVEENINFALGWDRDFLHMMLALEEIQCVIGGAITGEAPNAFTWGPLNAVNFLRVVHDVASWASTNFVGFP
jgi:hypothetical protein